MLTRKREVLALALPFFLMPMACIAGTIAESGKASLAPILYKVTPGVVNISSKKVEVVDSPVMRDPVMRELLDIPERGASAGNASSRLRGHHRCGARVRAHQ